VSLLLVPAGRRSGYFEHVFELARDAGAERRPRDEPELAPRE
jgi:hypothetical protein